MQFRLMLRGDTIADENSAAFECDCCSLNYAIWLINDSEDPFRCMVCSTHCSSVNCVITGSVIASMFIEPTE